MISKRGDTYWTSFYAKGGKRVRESLHTSDKGEATLLEAKLKLTTCVTIKAKGYTIGDAWEHAWRVRDGWRSSKAPRGIIQGYEQVLKRFGGENTLLEDVTGELLLDWGEEMHEAGSAGGTINQKLGIVSVLFAESIKWRKYHGVKPWTIRYKVGPSRKRLITLEEQAEVLAILRDMGTPYSFAMADLIVVLADTGMRLSEALNLVPSNISHGHRAVLIQKTKNDEDRVVPLTGRAYGVLQERMHNTPMFDPLTNHTASQMWRRVRWEMGMDDEGEFVMHAFRHTYGSTLANAGTDAFRLQKVMGHKSIITTQGYIHVSMSALEGLADVMEERNRTVYPGTRPKVEFGSSKNGIFLNEINEVQRLETTVNPQVPGSSPGRGANTHAVLQDSTPCITLETYPKRTQNFKKRHL